MGFVSLGCAKNLVDSQTMASTLLAGAFPLAQTPEQADVVIVNTCAFIEAAREESVAAILDACALKRTGPCRAVIVAGCLPQRYRGELRASLPEVDAFIGLDELRRIGAVIMRVWRGAHGLLQVGVSSHRLFEPRGPTVLFSGGPFAYVKIAEGCDHRCAFCAIPAIRGRHRSRPPRGIVAEVESLLERGVREINLISQDTTAYGSDRRDGVDLPALLRRLGSIGGHFWIRILYGYPIRADDRLFAAMAETRQVCHYLDIPVQHSHPDILRAMRRAETIRPLTTLAARARAFMPDIALRTTCLVGFPGERETHFRHLLAFIRETGFDHLGAFVFSPEADTSAATLRPRPSKRVAESRLERLMLAQREVVTRRARALHGVTTEALVLRQSDAGNATSPRQTYAVARTARLAPEVDGIVRVNGLPPTVVPGQFIQIRIIGNNGYDLNAVACPVVPQRPVRR